jgi:hypothetical protein
VSADNYLGAQILLGQVTGSGDQVGLPGAPPVDSFIKHVVWTVSGTPTDPAFAASFCVAASTDGTNLFHTSVSYRTDKAEWEGEVGPGDCGVVDNHGGGGPGGGGGGGGGGGKH